MRHDVEFNAEGVTLRGWLYVPDGASGPVPAIVMAHGFSAVKEMYLDAFAEVFAQVPLISGHHNARRLVRADFIASVREAFDADREARFRGEAPAMVPVVDEDPLATSALPTPDSWAWFSETGRTRAPSWRNEVTLRSVEMFWEYEPGTYIPWVSPTPLLIVVAEGDHLTVSDLAIEAIESAREPKRLAILPGVGHFDAYVKGFDAASGAARDWFVEHLRPGG